MKKFLIILFATITILSVQSQSASKLKKELLNSIEQKTTELTTCLRKQKLQKWVGQRVCANAL